MIVYNEEQTTGNRQRAIVNQQNIVKGKWKFFCAALSLLYAGNSGAMYSDSSDYKMAKSNSSLSEYESDTNQKRSPVRKQSRLKQKNQLNSLKQTNERKSSGTKESTEIEELKKIIQDLQKTVEQQQNLINMLLSEQKSQPSISRRSSKYSSDSDSESSNLNSSDSEEETSDSSSSESLNSPAFAKKNNPPISQKSDVKRSKMDLLTLLYLEPRDIEFRGGMPSSLSIKGEVFCKSENKEEIYRKFLDFYGIKIPGNESFESKFQKFKKLNPQERVKYIVLNDSNNISNLDLSTLEKCENKRVELMNYINLNDIEKVKKMINSLNSNLNAKNGKMNDKTIQKYSTRILFKDIVNLPDVSTGETPLWIAIKKGNLEMVNLLLQNGADANGKGESSDSWRGPRGVRRVLVAMLELEDSAISDEKKFNMLKLLLKYGANPKIGRGIKGYPSLIAAITSIKDKKIRYDAAKLLLETDSSVVGLSAPGPNHPYLFAAETGDEDLKKLLRDYGADTSRVDDDDGEITWY